MANRRTRVTKRFLRPFQQFFELEASGGILLIIATVVALVMANSPLYHFYHEVWEYDLTIGIGEGALRKPLHFWVNDGLMAIFFFLVGLEIKREIMAGELASMNQASLPLIAAIGGMVVPASLYAAMTWGTPAIDGWGIPMATDIAFSLGILKLLGNRVPLSAKIFLTAFAIVDDIGAVLVIALFYTASIAWDALVFAGLFYILILVMNYYKVRRISWYIVIGIVIWYFFLLSGIHPTVAGVLVAFSIPASRKINVKDYVDTVQHGLDEFKSSSHQEVKEVLNVDQMSAISSIEKASEKVQSPLQRLEHALHEFVIYIIMPIFALANAGVVLTGSGDAPLLSYVSLSIAAGLVVGKVLGVFLFTWLGVKLRLTSLPYNMNWINIFGLGLIGGIGFTMSLFIANLAFADAALLSQGKIGILLGSLIAGIAGYIILRRSYSPLKDDLEEQVIFDEEEESRT